MPTVKCKRNNCRFIGEREPICIARKTENDNKGTCITYEPRNESTVQLMSVPGAGCHRENRRYKSNHVTVYK